MHTGELYLPNDDEIFQDQIRKLDRLYDFNMTRPTQLDKRKEMLKEMFAEIVISSHRFTPIWQVHMSILEKMSMPTLT